MHHSCADCSELLCCTKYSCFGILVLAKLSKFLLLFSLERVNYLLLNSIAWWSLWQILVNSKSLTGFWIGKRITRMVNFRKLHLMLWTWSLGMIWNDWRRSGWSFTSLLLLLTCHMFCLKFSINYYWYKLLENLSCLCLSFISLSDGGRNHRGLRHYWGLRVRGQHTKTTGRRGKTVGVSKKR